MHKQAEILEDLVRRLKKLYRDAHYIRREDVCDCLVPVHIPTNSGCVKDFLEDLEHFFRSAGRGNLFLLPKGWTHISVQETVSKARATAIRDGSGFVRMIIMIDRDGNPVSVEITSLKGG